MPTVDTGFKQALQYNGIKMFVFIIKIHTYIDVVCIYIIILIIKTNPLVDKFLTAFIVIICYMYVIRLHFISLIYGKNTAKELFSSNVSVHMKLKYYKGTVLKYCS